MKTQNIKTKYYFIGISILIIIILFIILNDTSNNKICDAHKTNSLTLMKEPYLIKIFKENDNLLLKIQFLNSDKKEIIYKASSVLHNFFNEINPLCSEIVYKLNPENFKESFCFLAENYSICRGKVLQKGYPVSIKEKETLSKNMYILNTYPWQNIEETIIQIQNEPQNLNRILNFIDSRIWNLPEKSFIAKVKFSYNNKKFLLNKKKEQWFLNQNPISPGIAMKFVNQIVMMEEDINFKNIYNKNELIPLITINFMLDFQEWKFSLFQKKDYKFTIYKTSHQPEEFLIEVNQNIKFLKKYSYDQLMQNLNTLIKQLPENKES
ncbi:MAG: hypothetical protein KatS3mg129_2899 [Leptospiraceae bacterium]|nr:MAG: hypothetical protein KatS3mg129_2899 [Leptospiraceae bacterium]